MEELRDVLREMSSAAGLKVIGTPRKVILSNGTGQPGPGVTSQGIVAPPSPSLSRRHTFNNQPSNGTTAAPAPANGALGHRQGSSESLVSSVSQRSSLSTNSSKVPSDLALSNDLSDIHMASQGSKGDKNSTSSGGSKDSKDASGLTKNPKRSWVRSNLVRTRSFTSYARLPPQAASMDPKQVSEAGSFRGLCGGNTSSSWVVQLTIFQP